MIKGNAVSEKQQYNSSKISAEFKLHPQRGLF
jgi:hypothetical protein